MQFGARYTGAVGGEVEITCPDGTTLLTSDADCDARLSAALDHRVTLWPLQPADQLDHYRRGPADSADVMEELRGIFGREAGEPLPDFSVFPPELTEFESPPGTYLDAFPIMFMSTSALRALDAGAARRGRRRRAPLPPELRRRHRRLARPSGDRPGRAGGCGSATPSWRCSTRARAA